MSVQQKKVQYKTELNDNFLRWMHLHHVFIHLEQNFHNLYIRWTHYVKSSVEHTKRQYIYTNTQTLALLSVLSAAFCQYCYSENGRQRRQKRQWRWRWQQQKKVYWQKSVRLTFARSIHWCSPWIRYQL